MLLAMILVMAPSTMAEVGDCMYGDDQCSCKIGSGESGVCLDLISGSDNNDMCKARYCKSGWTCACQGRTDLCNMTEVQARIPGGTSGSAPIRQAVGEMIPCHKETRMSAGSRGKLILGSFLPKYSRKGLLNGNCKHLAWWVDGNMIRSYGTEEVSADNVDEILNARANNTRFPLRPGSVIAFRFKNASYHCFNSFATVLVNGTKLDTNNPTVKVRFSRAHKLNWFAPDANIVYAEDESTAAVTDFVPMRRKMLFDGSDIASGKDNWKPPDGSEDHKRSNFYFRFEV